MEKRRNKKVKNRLGQLSGHAILLVIPRPSEPRPGWLAASLLRQCTVSYLDAHFHFSLPPAPLAPFEIPRHPAGNRGDEEERGGRGAPDRGATSWDRMGLEMQGRSIGDRDPEGRHGRLPSNQDVWGLLTPVDVRVQICRIVRLVNGYCAEGGSVVCTNI